MNIAPPSENSPPASDGADNSQAMLPNGTLRRQRGLWSSRFAAAVRWLHIYLSLLGFTALTFFALTGITLNHPTWFGGDAQQLTQLQGELPTDWLRQTIVTSSNDDADDERDSRHEVDRLAVVEFLRETHALRGVVGEFRIDDYECLILFKGPGTAADITIDRDSGRYTGTKMETGAVAIMNDLHKGRDSGPYWSLVIDVSAVVMLVTTITGLVLIFYIKRRRWSGVLTAVAGTLLFIAVWLFGVP